jgi:hypothetical protein
MILIGLLLMMMVCRLVVINTGIMITMSTINHALTSVAKKNLVTKTEKIPVGTG